MIMPPSIGAAIRCFTSLPVPEPMNSGKRPPIMTATINAKAETSLYQSVRGRSEVDSLHRQTLQSTQ